MEYIIKTPCGDLRGTKTKYEGVVAYKGIRYATAGRFEYPTEVTRWEGIYDATEYGACAYQPRSFYDEEQMPKRYFTITNSVAAKRTDTARIVCFSTFLPPRGARESCLLSCISTAVDLRAVADTKSTLTSPFGLPRA